MNIQTIINELEEFKQAVKLYFASKSNPYSSVDTTLVRETIAKRSRKIKQYLKSINIVTSVSARAAPVAGGFPYGYDLIDDIFQNEGTPYGVQPSLVIDTLNKAIGVYEEALESGALPGSLSKSVTEQVREGFFIDGQYYEAQKFVRDFFVKSKKSITIIDNYIDTTVLDLLTAKNTGVVVDILTKNVAKDVKAAGQAFVKQYGRLNIRCSNAFHDRFIIIDSKSFYHLGASIKDLGNRTFMFSMMEESEMISLLKRKMKDEWKKGKVII